MYPPINYDCSLAAQMQIEDIGSEGYQTGESASEYQQRLLSQRRREQELYFQEKQKIKEEREEKEKAEKTRAVNAYKEYKK